MNDFESIESMQLNHAKMKRAFNLKPMPTHAERVEKLKSLRHALLDFSERICVAMSADYGNRSFQDTKIADILPCIANIVYSIEHVEGWMAPSIRHSGALLSVSEVTAVP